MVKINGTLHSARTSGIKNSVENFKNWNHTWFIQQSCALSEFDVISITLYNIHFQKTKKLNIPSTIYNYLSISVEKAFLSILRPTYFQQIPIKIAHLQGQYQSK